MENLPRISVESPEWPLADSLNILGTSPPESKEPLALFGLKGLSVFYSDNPPALSEQGLSHHVLISLNS